MTDDDLDRAERLAAAATPGPWETDDTRCCVYAPTDENRLVAQVVISADGTEADADFIAAARVLIPALVAQVRALTAAGNTIAARVGSAVDEGRNIVPDATDDQSALIEAFAIELLVMWPPRVDS